jgi:Tfp pilus assembly protein PilP
MKQSDRHWALVGTALYLVFASQGLGQTGGREPSKPRKDEPAEPAAVVVRYQSAGRRDPFLNPLILGKKSDDEEESRGEPPPGIEGTYLEQAVLVGISRREGARTAVFQGPDRRAYFLQEGDRMFDGYVKTIQDESVLLIRETLLRSGKVLTQEVTKTLRSR